MTSMTKRFVFGLLATGAVLAGSYSAQAQSSCIGPFSMAGSMPRSLTDQNDEQIHGRDRFNLAASFRDRGVRVSSIEAWGGQIKADVVDEEDCAIYTQFFDADTLNPVRAGWQ